MYKRQGVDLATGGFTANGQAIDNLSGYMDRYISQLDVIAKRDALSKIKGQVIDAEVDFNVSKINREQLEKQMDEELSKVGSSFAEYKNMNPFEKWALVDNPFKGFNSSGLDEMLSLIHI